MHVVSISERPIVCFAKCNIKLFIPLRGRERTSHLFTLLELNSPKMVASGEVAASSIAIECRYET